MSNQQQKSLVAFNALSNYARFGIAIACTFVLTPFLVTTLGPGNYGLWTLLLCVAGYLELFECGLTTGVMRFISSAKQQDLDRKNRLVNTIFFSSFGLSFLAGMTGLALAFCFGLTYSNEPLLPLLVGVMTIRIMLSIPTGIFMGVLFGEQQIWLINLMRSASVLVFTVGACWMFSSSIDIVELGMWYSSVYALENVCYFFIARFRLKWLRIWPGGFSFSILKEVAGFCLSSLTANTANVVLTRTDPFIVSASLSLSAVALYAVPLRVTEQLFQLSKQLINVFSPVFAELHGSQKTEQIRSAYLTCSKFSWGLMVVVVVPAIVFSREGLRVWVGEAFVVSGPILCILLIAALLRVLQESACSTLAMTGRHVFVARITIISAISNVALSLILVQFFGLIGVSLATLLSVAIFGCGLSTLEACRSFGVSWSKYVADVVAPVLLPISAQLVSLAVLCYFMPQQHLVHLLVISCLSGVTYLVAYLMFSLCKSEREIVRNWLLAFRIRAFGIVGAIRPFSPVRLTVNTPAVVNQVKKP
jgi:O-antigen/teichoic acid export membrane protein